MRGSTIFRVGGQLKRLLVMLLKSRKRKTPTKADANRAWQFSPTNVEKRQRTIREKETAPPQPRAATENPTPQSMVGQGKKTSELTQPHVPADTTSQTVVKKERVYQLHA
jgi:hypothetical protein